MQAGVTRNTKRVGDYSEIRVMHDLVKAGYLVAVPFGENQRYDLIADKGGVLFRVQVKTGRLRKGVIVFNCYSSHAHRGGQVCRRYTGEVEYFGVYCGDTDCTYLVPLSELPVQQGNLRIQPATNRQVKGLRWADHYILGKGAAYVPGQVGTTTVAAVPASSPILPL